ncbi:MAG: hypothetical protein UT69_C0037G0013 [Candidatus Yanofskybacteria bacterium GW2011_GWE1_40_10]|nr:MAG: hypothetical protein UT69_C0037G0013 [Candidatus Yanofskybacteria bacterium GW2011_GWE1_40_10]
MEKKTIEIPNSEKLSFTFRTDNQQDRSAAKEVALLVELGKLGADDLLEWAYSAMIVSFQSKLRSKNPPKAEEDGSYKWTVPSRGTRSVADPAKLEEAANKLVDKMGPKEKYHLMVKMGVDASMAAQMTGYKEEETPNAGA